jgi:hypothetical protein
MKSERTSVITYYVINVEHEKSERTPVIIH